MLNEDIRRRLARLHLGRSDARALTADAIRRPTRASSNATAGSLGEQQWLAASHECENASGRHQRIRHPIDALWPKAQPVIAEAMLGAPGACRPGSQSPAQTPPQSRPLDAAGSHPELAALAQWFPHQTLFLDLETCGFAGSMVFLVGLVRNDAGRLVIDQLLARTYAEERTVLQTLWQIAADHRVLVTFNGKSFDWPMVHDRSTRYHLGRDLRGQPASGATVPQPDAGLSRDDARPELVHCDLLHHARRRWKGLLPNCRLQTLERYLCGRVRHDDLPGSLVPEAYHHFVRTGQTHQLGAILRHNALDLVTLAQLACRMLGGDATAVRPAAKSA